jgi:hypothetical protein
MLQMLNLKHRSLSINLLFHSLGVAPQMEWVQIASLIFGTCTLFVIPFPGCGSSDGVVQIALWDMHSLFHWVWLLRWSGFDLWKCCLLHTTYTTQVNFATPLASFGILEDFMSTRVCSLKQTLQVDVIWTLGLISSNLWPLNLLIY